MDELLATIGSQAMKYAIRSGIALTSRYALGQCSRLLTAVDDEDIPGREKNELATLQKLLESKIKVIAPTIDLVEFKSGRGNVFLDSALPLTKSLHRDIVSLGQRIEDTAANIEKTGVPVALERQQVNKIVTDIKELLGRMDREIPLLQLAITASGESLSSSLPPGTSPSRLLQASTLLTFGDTKFSQQPDQVVQIGPEFCLSLYMLFLGHAPSSRSAQHSQDKLISQRSAQEQNQYGIGEGDRKPIWKEVVHKARVRLCRASCPTTTEKDEAAFEYSYYLDIVEDENDGRVHEQPVADPSLGGHFWSRKQKTGTQGQPQGIEERVPVHQVSKIFYTDSGRLLNIGDDTQDGKNPVLLLKRDGNSTSIVCQADRLSEYREDELDSGQQVSTGEEDIQAELDQQLFGDEASAPQPQAETRNKGFPKHLDPEWIAMEMYEEAADEDESSSEASESDQDQTQVDMAERTFSKSPCDGKDRSPNAELDSQIRKLSLRQAVDADKTSSETPPTDAHIVARSPFGGIQTSLSLIEMLIRLASLQEFQQASHLTIPDHILTFFLEETSTTGLVGEAQWRARTEAKTRVGFDPYSDNAGGNK